MKNNKEIKLIKLFKKSYKWKMRKKLILNQL